ncbi:MAG: glutaredoxin family protein [Candidatus Saccharimonadales bacterium]
MVTIYSAQWCGFCHAAKQYFTQKNVAFEEKDIDKDPAFATEAKDLSGQTGIPVIKIDTTVIVGFDRPKIDFALKQTA